MNKIKKQFAYLTWFGAGALVRSIYEPQHIIVAYHSIWSKRNRENLTGDKYSHISISAEDFKRQIDHIKSRGYTFIRFSDYTTHADTKTASVYFDDGFRDVLINALPTLERENVPATLFLTTDYLDGKKDPHAYLSWDELKSFGDAYEFGSHSVSHQKLNKISIDKAEEEMIKSKQVLEAKTGKRVTAFSFPYGRSSFELQELAKKVGYTLTTADIIFHKVRPDPDDSSAVFKWKMILSW